LIPELKEYLVQICAEIAVTEDPNRMEELLIELTVLLRAEIQRLKEQPKRKP
jgi:hypothetical protein